MLLIKNYVNLKSTISRTQNKLKGNSCSNREYLEACPSPEFGGSGATYKMGA
jgi:hypothetical protein